MFNTEQKKFKATIPDKDEVLDYAEDCMRMGIDIVSMNRLISAEDRWDEFESLVAETNFATYGKQIGITPRAYAMVKEAMGDEQQRPAIDTLIGAKKISSRQAHDIIEKRDMKTQKRIVDAW